MTETGNEHYSVTVKLNMHITQFNLIADIYNYRRYPQFKLLISIIKIADISNLNCRYQQFELRISTIADTRNSNCQYRQFEQWISTI